MGREVKVSGEDKHMRGASGMQGIHPVIPCGPL